MLLSPSTTLADLFPIRGRNDIEMKLQNNALAGPDGIFELEQSTISRDLIERNR